MSSNAETNQRIQNELNRKLVYSSLAAAPGFIMTAAWVCYNKFETKAYVIWITYLGFFMMILPIVRFVTSILHEKNKISLSLAAKLIKINILINAVLWSIAILLPIIEYELSHTVSSIDLIALLLAITISSIITLSYSIHIAYAFQWIMMVSA